MSNPEILIFDYETLSNNPRKAAVISFAAILCRYDDIDLDDLQGAVERLSGLAHYVTIDPVEQIKNLDLETSESTLEWWSKQSGYAQEMLKSKDKVSVYDHCRLFTEYCIEKGIHQKVITWNRAPQFDSTILENLFEKCGYPMPYNFWKVRDIRTAIDVIFGEESEYRGYIPNFRDSLSELNLVEHYAVHDCIKDLIQLKMIRSIVR